MNGAKFSPYITAIYDNINDVEICLNSITSTGELLKDKSLKNVNLRQLQSEISGNLNAIKTLLNTKKFKNLQGEELNNDLKKLSDKITKIRDNTTKFNAKFVDLMSVKTEEGVNNIQRRKELLKLNEEIRSQNEEITAEKKEIIKIKEVKEVVDSQKQKCEKKIKRAKRREKAFKMVKIVVAVTGGAFVFMSISPLVIFALYAPVVAGVLISLGGLFFPVYFIFASLYDFTRSDRLEDEEKLKNLNNL